MLGYHISIGYLSGSGWAGSKTEANEWLADMARQIVDYAALLDGWLPEPPDGHNRDEAARDYLQSGVTIGEDTSADDFQVMITASGSDDWRIWKEDIARRFVMTLFSFAYDAELILNVHGV